MVLEPSDQKGHPTGDTGNGADSGPILVSVRRLTKAYGPRLALSEASFDLTPGVCGVLGPNGAGKSTLIRCLAGLCPWDQGEVRLVGLDPARRARQARALVGYMPERLAFPPEMRVHAYLRFAAEVKGLRRADRQGAVEAALQRTGLETVESRIIANLSKGYRQRVGLAQAMLGDPPVLILDEPTAGLDPLNIMEIRRSLRSYAEGRLVLVSTHILPEIRQLCDHVLVLTEGRLVYDGSTEEMTSGQAPIFRLRIRRSDDGSSEPFVDQPGATVLEWTGANGRYDLVLAVEGEIPLGKVIGDLSKAGWLVVGMESHEGSFEAAFRNAVLGTGTAARAGEGRGG